MVRGRPRPITPVRLPVLWTPTSTPTISPNAIPDTIHNRGSEEGWRPDGERSRSGELRSNEDYAAPGAGAPRGRKPDGGLGADSPRAPTRAEGEKRFRSAIRNP